MASFPDGTIKLMTIKFPLMEPIIQNMDLSMKQDQLLVKLYHMMISHVSSFPNNWPSDWQSHCWVAIYPMINAHDLVCQIYQ